MPLGFNQDVSSSQSSKQIVRHGASFVRTHPQPLPSLACSLRGVQRTITISRMKVN
jgi:hypothetical protein